MSVSSGVGRSLLVVALALSVRVVHLFHVVPTPLFSYHTEFPDSDMFLIDQWAQRIADGDVLGRSPYQPVAAWQRLIGPDTSWREWYGGALTFYKAPFYAYLIAGLRVVFGDPMLPLALLQIAASGVSVFLVARLGQRLLGEPAGLAGALLFALYAPAIHFDVVMLRGPWIVLFSLLATHALVRLEERPGLGRAALVGAATGLALLTNEGFGPVPVLVLALFLARWGFGRRTALAAGGFALGFLPLLAPVVLRNLAVGAAPLRLAVTGGTVLAVFNGVHANPYAFDVRPQPVALLISQGHGDSLATILACLRSFPSFTELLRFYAAKASGLLIPFENPDNVNYYYAALKDPLLGFLPGYATVLSLALVGVALLGRRVRALWPLVPFAATLLLTILLTMTLSRYRVTLTVFLFLPAGFALARFVGWARERRLLALSVGLGATVLLACASLALEGAVLGPRPVADGKRYRPAEFFLGVNYYARRGRPEAAIAEAMELVRRNPEPGPRSAALLQVARLQLYKGEKGPAAEALERATSLSPGDPELLTAVGDLQRDGLGDRAAAAASFRGALAVAPPGPFAEALRDRLASVTRPPGP